MLNIRVRPLALLLCALFASPAGAGPNDALHLYANVGYGHDDNLLRVPDDQPAFDGTRADSWWEREAGLIFDIWFTSRTTPPLKFFLRLNM